MDSVFTQGSPEDQFALLDALLMQAPVGTAFWDPELRYRRINPALAAMNGVSIEEHIGRTVEEVLGPLGADICAVLRRVLDTGVPATEVPIVGVLPSDPGTERCWRGSYYPVGDADGRVRGLGGVVVETTAQHRAQGEADAARALIDAVFDASPVAMAFWDRELRYQRINEAGARLNALPREAHLGRAVDEVITGELGEQIVALLRRVLETGEVALDVELSGGRPGRPGEQHRRAGSYYPLPGPGGEIAGVGAVVQDITARHRAEFLARVGDALAASLDYAQTLQTVAEVAVPAVADCCALVLTARGDELELAAVSHADPELGDLAREMFARHTPRRRDEHSAATAIRTGRPVTAFEIPPGALDAAARDEAHRAELQRLAPRSLIVVPVAARGSVLGSLTLMYSRPGRRYDEQDVLLAQALADRAALAIENARLHTERTHIARTLQHSLLPHSLPAVPGIEVAASYHAAGGENEVGGDFYDIYQSEPGVFTLFIGDVAGKGAEAAAVTALARYTLRAASMLDSCPVRNLELLNDALLGRDSGTCTAVYGQLRPEPGAAELNLAIAGHPPPLLQRADGRVEELATRGILLGAVHEPALERRAERLGPGDLVLLYTDGATDVRTPSGVLGDGPLRRELAACAGCTAQVVVDRIAAAISRAQDGTLDDDLALLAVRVNPD